jgi:hypothetical protein
MDLELEVRYISPEKGRGVFTSSRFCKGDSVEYCPVLFTFEGFEALGDKTGLSDWEFIMPNGSVAIVGGLGHFYNHSDTPNVELLRGDSDFLVRALRDIDSGEELTHKYLCDPWWNNG